MSESVGLTQEIEMAMDADYPDGAHLQASSPEVQPPEINAPPAKRLRGRDLFLGRMFPAFQYSDFSSHTVSYFMLFIWLWHTAS